MVKAALDSGGVPPLGGKALAHAMKARNIQGFVDLKEAPAG